MRLPDAERRRACRCRFDVGEFFGPRNGAASGPADLDRAFADRVVPEHRAAVCGHLRKWLRRFAAYAERPNLTVIQSTASTGSSSSIQLGLGIDLLRDIEQAIAAPGQSNSATIGFQVERGFADTGFETEAVSQSAAAAQGAPVATGVNGAGHLHGGPAAGHQHRRAHAGQPVAARRPQPARRRDCPDQLRPGGGNVGCGPEQGGHD